MFLGDCREVLRGFPSEGISCCITDPPYNYEFIGHKWDANEIDRRLSRVKDTDNTTLVKNIPYGSGLAGGVRNERWYNRVRNNILEYQEWCFEWGTELFRVCKPGAIIAVFNSTRTVAHVQVALERAGFYTRDCIVYRRHSGIPKGDNLALSLKQKGKINYRDFEGWHSCLLNTWEAVVILQKPLEENYLTTFLKYGVGYFYTKNEDGSFQSNILENIPRSKEDQQNVHCTVKPLALMEKLIKICTPISPNHIVLDPFAGSGTTLVAAKKLGVSYVGIEMVGEYIEVINKRVENYHSGIEIDNPPIFEQQTLPLFGQEKF